MRIVSDAAALGGHPLRAELPINRKMAGASVAAGASAVLPEGTRRMLVAGHATVRTPCYVYDTTTLDESVREYRGLFPPGTRHFYSLKANAQSALIARLQGHGFGAETSSPAELAVATAAGLASRELIVGGPAKGRHLLRQAAERRLAALVVDSDLEVHSLGESPAAEGAPRVLLRVGLDPWVAFGLPPERALALLNGSDSAYPNSGRMAGLHFHSGGQKLSVEHIIDGLQSLTSVLDQVRLRASARPILLVGLGIGVPYNTDDPEPNRELLAERMGGLLTGPPWNRFELWTEAGRALAARAGTYVTRVVDRKEKSGRVFVFVDGGLHVHNPGLALGRFFRSNPHLAVIRADPDPQADEERMTLMGSLCTPADVLARDVVLPRLRPGDLIAVANSGAYCLTSAMLAFNGRPPYSETMIDELGNARDLTPQWRSILPGVEG